VAQVLSVCFVQELFYELRRITDPSSPRPSPTSILFSLGEGAYQCPFTIRGDIKISQNAWLGSLGCEAPGNPPSSILLR